MKIFNNPNGGLMKILIRFAVLFIMVPVFIFAKGNAPEDAVASLKAGNQRYVEGKFKARNYRAERTEQSKGQHPYAIILTCSDSRVAPELLFDESLGRIFIIRVAGNVTDPVVLGSIEYAAEHLHVPLLVVLGHTKCGAVKATVEGGHAPKNIDTLVAKIAPAVKKAREKAENEEDILSKAVEENVYLQVANAAKESAILRELVHENKLKIMGAMYDIDSGKVEFYSGATASH